jgi:hypothetical protein
MDIEIDGLIIFYILLNQYIHTNLGQCKKYYGPPHSGTEKRWRK